jgi:hypothetical protein
VRAWADDSAVAFKDQHRGRDAEHTRQVLGDWRGREAATGNVRVRYWVRSCRASHCASRQLMTQSGALPLTFDALQKAYSINSSELVQK